jgi:hypothetical protein
MGWLSDRIHKCPPPVEQEWMLILVLDVQLEIACFSWGYKLDPYVNPDTINTCIVKTKLLFRERAMVAALKEVMERAVRHIAIDSHRANKSLKNAVSAGKTRALRTLTTAAGISLLTAGPTGHAEQEFQNDDVAEIVMPAPEPAPAPAADPMTGAAPVKPTMSLDDIQIPGTILSGKCEFPSGTKVAWQIDQMGQLNCTQLSGTMTPEEQNAFVFELRQILSKM